MCNSCFDGLYFACEQKQFEDFLQGFVPGNTTKKGSKRRPVLVVPGSAPTKAVAQGNSEENKVATEEQKAQTEQTQEQSTTN